ncbi:MAG: DUF4132 domain-containing protein [Myxococcales bacterium]|nr:DUF4132 domain-containing protein [Myxococcales bacterium]
MFEGLTRFFGKLRAPKTLPAVLEEYESGRRHPVLPPLLVALGEFQASRPAPEREAWRALLLHLDEVTGATPTRRWLTLLVGHAERVGLNEFATTVTDWLGLMDAAACDFSPALTRGLVWLTLCLDGDAMAPVLGALAERADRKIAGRGPMSRGVVNACLRVLGSLEGDAGVVQLTRLKGVIEYRDAHHHLDRAFAGAATRRDLSVEQLEERVVPDASELNAPIGAWTPTITFEDGAPVLGWVRADGKRVRRVPAELQREHAEAVAARKATFAEFEEVLEAQTNRLERLFWTQRTISLSDFHAHSLGHPVVMLLARALVWTVGDRPALWFDGAFVDVDGKVFEPLESATVQLWHPVLATAESVAAWRRRLEALELTQPFAQVERPVFTLDDAELVGGLTRRWQGRRMRQQRLQTLCRRRQWQSTRLEPRMADVVVRAVEPYALHVMLEVAAEGPETTASGASTWLHTGALRLQSPRELKTIPAVVLSEVLLEVDGLVRGSEAAESPAANSR